MIVKSERDGTYLAAADVTIKVAERARQSQRRFSLNKPVNGLLLFAIPIELVRIGVLTA
jgi:hypothetical protein